MIDWRISPDFEAIEGRGWFFPSLEIQEYLLPQLNVGNPFIDEYGGTTFSAEDCARLKGNIEYLMDSGILDRRSAIRFDSLRSGLVTLSCEDIRECLKKLHAAVEETIRRNGVLKFFGD